VPVYNLDQALGTVLTISLWSAEEAYRLIKAFCRLEEMELFSFDKQKN
jgi:hypothetical protein